MPFDSFGRRHTASVAPTALPLPLSSLLLLGWLNAIENWMRLCIVVVVAFNRRHINSFSFFAFDFIQFEYIFCLSLSLRVSVTPRSLHEHACVSVCVCASLNDFISYAWAGTQLTRFSFPIILFSFAFLVHFEIDFIHAFRFVERIFGYRLNRFEGNFLIILLLLNFQFYNILMNFCLCIDETFSYQ